MKEETREKLNDLDIVEVHSFHSILKKYYMDKQCMPFDSDIEYHVINNTKPKFEINCDILYIDEA